MPLYSYVCTQCSKKFDLLVGVTRDQAPPQCPACHSRRLQKEFASFGIAGSTKGASRCGSCSGGSCERCA